MIQHWRANVDLQLIIDAEVCARYIAKYASKNEPRSQPVSAIFKSCIDNLSDTSDPHIALRSAMIRSMGERDFSAQETAHQLLSLPLISCTFTFVTLSLNNNRTLEKDKDSGEHVILPSIIDKYATRTSLYNVNLVTFVAEYSIISGEIRKRHTPVIVRTFPQYSSDPHSEHYNQYCKYQLIRYKPWIGHISNAWDNVSEDDDIIAAYHRFLSTPAAAICIPQFKQDLEQADEYLQQEDICTSDIEDNQQENEQHEDWMFLCHLHQEYSQHTNSQDPQYANWNAAADSLSPEILQACPTWIKSQREYTNNLDNTLSPWQRQLPPVDITTLNTNQFKAYQIIHHHFKTKNTGDIHPSPLHMLICGTAGTGKSYLITAIAQLLGCKCILTGTTGIAAYNICGKTLHSTLQLPLNSNSYKDLQGNSLQRLQLTIKHKEYLLIDEMSMLGQRMLAIVDKRLRQATAHLNIPFGGVSVILIGDFAQLPPVGDRPLYCSDAENCLAIHGYSTYKLFSTVVILDEILRQNGTDPSSISFKQFLHKLRDGKVSQDDWHMLLTRSPQEAANSDTFSNAIRLYYDRKSVAQYNLQKLQDLQTPIAQINAIHSNNEASKADADDAGGLQRIILLAPKAEVMLTANLWQPVGLCNGAAGTVYQLLYQTTHQPPDLPIAVLVDFYQYTGPAFIQERPKCIPPIPPLLFEWNKNGKHLSRQQLPLKLRYAITIHKSQGQTLNKTVIDIGKKELAIGCTFVALSRVRSLTDMLIQPMSFQRLANLTKAKRFQERLQEELRLKQLTLHS